MDPPTWWITPIFCAEATARFAWCTTGTRRGLFSRGDWLRLLSERGSRRAWVPFDHSELGPGSYEVLVGRKP